ncbi:MAG: deoxyguanosinetriphosphate triphosphohydrolase [Rickettsiaceae bacterium]|nr:deoxyguanosinetriphosphate triphosphohydrolase [Rickettsiaceae bacterium]
MLKHLATLPNLSKGRLHTESACLYRNSFQRDKDRILHSNAFRRLQYKTQVFINHEGDHYRNRLTHSLEVASIARSVAKYLELSEDLAEAISLAHDIGHTAFGHAGERALNKEMEAYGGFSHNLNSFKILVQLEQRYMHFDGLNLTWETIDGLLKHNGPIKKPVDAFIQNYAESFNIPLDDFSSLEAQIAAIADDIAYLSHDLEDGLRSGLLTFDELEAIDEMAHYLVELRKENMQNTTTKLAYELSRKITSFFTRDLIDTILINAKEMNFKSSYDVRNASCAIALLSNSAFKFLKDLKHLLFVKIYYNKKLKYTFDKAEYVIKSLFRHYMDNKNLPSQLINASYKNQKKFDRVQIIADYIAGMTDRYAIAEFERIYSMNFDDIKI